MNSRNVVRLFFSTLAIGGISTLIASFFVKTGAYIEFMNPIDWFEILGLFIFFLALGFVFSLISQMGFFAYLTVNQFALGVFRRYWPIVQIGLIAFALFDLVYFRFQAEGGSLLTYILVAVLLLVYSWIVAGIKAKETNRKAFIPALFFMVVITAIEWVPGLRTSGGDYAWLMIVPLVICNTYQLLILHRLTDQSKREREMKEQS
ncbi:KinB signaling pathway activation protein [Gracilibacillus halophilus YIM-C55.5]|uniref:KinB signaling pathway activation protein n=1 Tax=Gracilibacillus halophilus YIM-C55.5 TaxID=1308866 RepID=N4WC18_9BACI|nr:KinB-signaling pathway activation protein [Gracilibacillus halophilus]ENH97833.1 KinB signaling pathway activation protein [Gracilibacillus halophilus YIM-C55.5]